jgi:LacI family transcriptional regulator
MEKKKRPITLRDVARVARVSHATVSRALRNHAAIPFETCRRIQALAEKLGYRRNVVVSMLMSQLRKYPRSPYQGTLAFVTSDPTADGWKTGKPYNVRSFKGAQDRAGYLGYRLEEFWIKAPEMTAKRAQGILQARGIRGLIIAPLPKALGHITLDWSHFASVTIGYTMNLPHLHSAKNDHYHTASLALRKLRSLHYKRIGFVLSPLSDKYSNGVFTARYLLHSHNNANSETIPIFSKTEDVFGTGEEQFEAFKKWYKQYRPDAIVCMGQRVLGWLERIKVSVPRDLGVVYLDIHNAEAEHVSGVDECEEVVAGAAVELLVQQIEHNDLGIPGSPKTVLMEGRWVNGETVSNSISTLSVKDKAEVEPLK